MSNHYDPGEKYRVLRFLEYVCWAAGTLAILYAGLVSQSSMAFQTKQALRLDALRLLPVAARRFESGEPFGKISIPRLKRSAMIEEGVDERTLRHAVGHFPGSALPENTGTVVLAGHRDTLFRALAHVRTNDLILLLRPRGRYRYHVVRTLIVGPQHVEFARGLLPNPISRLSHVFLFTTSAVLPNASSFKPFGSALQSITRNVRKP